MTKSLNKKTIIGAALLILLFAVLMLVEHLPGVPPMLITVLKKGAVYALVAVSMNLLNGFTGLFSLGQAGFMLLGAYAYAILTIPGDKREAVYQYFDGGIINITVPVLVGLLAAGLLAALFAYLIGLPVLRLKSDYLAIATLGFAEIIRAVVQYKGIGGLTNASNLLYGFPAFNSLTFPFVVSGICIAAIVLLIRSTYGRAFKAIRDDEIAAEAMGINLASHKQMSFVISSFFAGVSGALLAMYQASVQASIFKASMTYEILLIVVIGGIGSITGSCLASFLFIACSEWWMRFLDSEVILNTASMPVFAAVSVLVTVGLVYLIIKTFRKKGGRSALIAKWLSLLGGGGLIAYIGYICIRVITEGNAKLPLLRSGFRMVLFSVVIMAVVLFYRQGIMGTREFSVEGLLRFWDNLKTKLSGKEKTV